MTDEKKLKAGDTLRRKSDGLEARVISVDNNVVTVECADWCDIILTDQWELLEESVNESIDFEQELYKAFSKVKDIILGIVIVELIIIKQN